MENKKMWVKNETDKSGSGLWKQIQEKHDSQLLWGKNKYYTPDISELCVGYQCECLDTRNDWMQFSIMLPNDISLDDTYRTKYLDSDDIISSGFTTKDNLNFVLTEGYYNKEEDITGYEYHLNRGTHTTHITIDRLVISYGKASYSCHEGNCDRIFSGKCKSKNELKKILEWIR